MMKPKPPKLAEQKRWAAAVRVLINRWEQEGGDIAALDAKIQDFATLSEGQYLDSEIMRVYWPYRAALVPLHAPEPSQQQLTLL